jgi:hypothetical protein
MLFLSGTISVSKFVKRFVLKKIKKTTITDFLNCFKTSNNMQIEYSKVPEHIGHVVERNEGIIDGDHLKALLESSTHNQTSNTTETVDAYIVKVTSFILLDFKEINRT